MSKYVHTCIGLINSIVYTKWVSSLNKFRLLFFKSNTKYWYGYKSSKYSLAEHRSKQNKLNDLTRVDFLVNNAFNMYYFICLL